MSMTIEEAKAAVEEAKAAVDDLCAQLNAYHGDNAWEDIVIDHPAVHDIYESGDYDFYNIELIDDRSMTCDADGDWSIWVMVAERPRRETQNE